MVYAVYVIDTQLVEFQIIILVIGNEHGRVSNRPDMPNLY
jgi:hypothetical protein